VLPGLRARARHGPAVAEACACQVRVPELRFHARRHRIPCRMSFDVLVISAALAF
jgi:hypothetical protein